MKIFIQNQIEHMDEQQLTQVFEFLKGINSLKEVNPTVISYALQIMYERKKVLEKLAQ